MYRSSLIHPSRMAAFLLPALALCGLAAPARGQAPQAEELFERKIRPLIVRHCAACHNSELATAGLDLSTAEGFRQGVAGSPLISAESPFRVASSEPSATRTRSRCHRPASWTPPK